MGRARSLGSTQQFVFLSCRDGHLSCPQSVWEEFFSFERRGEREREKRGWRGGRGVFWGWKGKGFGWMEGGKKKKKEMEGREGVEIAHRLRGLCVGPGGGLSGPLAFLCSLTLMRKTH